MSMQPVDQSRNEATAQIEEIPRRLVAERSPDETVEPEHAWYFPCKAAVEFLIALVLLVVSFPLLLLAAFSVKLTSRGPVFYCQTRLGKAGRKFTLCKLRTMVKDAEKLTGPVWAERDDPRITPVGRILRSAHVDELPQLINVLLGQMSLIGPRPERPEFASWLESELPHYGDRLKVRPGMTGMAQLQLPPDSTLGCVRRKLIYDLYYVRYVSPWLDARILLLTFARLATDAVKTLWHPLALPTWETVTRHVPSAIHAEFDCGDAEEGDRPGDGSVSRSHAYPKKAR